MKTKTIRLAAAIIDVDSLEGCGFFEDPNYFENRKAPMARTTPTVLLHPLRLTE